VNNEHGLAEGDPQMPQNLWHSQLLDWLRVTFRDLYHRAQTLEDLVRSASAISDDEAGRSQIEVDGAAWALAITVANTPRPPLPHIPADTDTAGSDADTELFLRRFTASS
jgi:hypothetical protein